MTDPHVEPPPLPPEEETVTFWDIVRAQFQKNTPAVVASRCVKTLIVMAMAAPLIAMNVPYVMNGPDGLEWPLSERLFNRILYPSGVDIFFNLLLILGPVWWFSKRVLDTYRTGGPRPWIYGGATAALLVLYVVWSLGRESIFGWLLLISLLGIGLFAYQHFRALKMPPRNRRTVAMQTRVALVGVFVVTFILTLTAWQRTSAPRDFETEIAALERTQKGTAITPPIFYHYDNVGDSGERIFTRILSPPSLKNRNILGCDNNGRDVFARLLFGTRISLTIGIVAVSIYVTIGCILGSLAGYFGGRVDASILGILQIMLCIPSFFLLLTIIAVFETRSIFMIMVAIGLVGWTGIARLVRGEFFRQKTIDYVVAARALGIPERRIIFGHILKNSLGPVLVSAAFGVAGAILTEAGLSFLGLGDQNAPSWGQLLMEGRNHRKDWLILSPGLAIFFVVTVLNLVGDGLRDAIDPKLRQ